MDNHNEDPLEPRSSPMINRSISGTPTEQELTALNQHQALGTQWSDGRRRSARHNDNRSIEPERTIKDSENESTDSSDSELSSHEMDGVDTRRRQDSSSPPLPPPPLPQRTAQLTVTESEVKVPTNITNTITASETMQFAPIQNNQDPSRQFSGTGYSDNQEIQNQQTIQNTNQYHHYNDPHCRTSSQVSRV